MVVPPRPATKDFLGKPAPPGYVAGLGRGATGFTTRPDIVPGSSISIPQQAPLPAETERDELDDNENEEGLLAPRGAQDADDDEADAIFAAIEARMNTRRKAKSTTVSAKRVNDPNTIFAKEKERLGTISVDEWAALPESGDFIAKRVKKSNDRERFTPLPDSVLLGSLGIGFGSAGEAREKVLGAKLDSMNSKSASKNVSVDAQGYLTSLDSMAGGAADLAELRKARILLKNAVQSNPDNASAWISAVKIEEISNNIKQAQLIITQALEYCPENEDVWLEAIRLASSATEKKNFATQAVKAVPKSIKIWLKASDLERDDNTAKRILRSGLEENPTSVTLWKALIEREEDAENARVLLAKAVECCPHDIELWIGLARLEDHMEARKVLNKARQINPMSVDIWLAAARLEEAHGDPNGMVNKIVDRAIDQLAQRGVELSRKEWLAKAAECDSTGDVLCAKSIVSATKILKLDEKQDDLLIIWLSDADYYQNENPNLSKALLEIAIQRYPNNELVWSTILDHPSNCRESKTRDFEAAVSACPNSEALWLRYIEFTKETDIQATFNLLQRALDLNNSNESLWMKLIKLYLDANALDSAVRVAKKACQTISSERTWLKYLKLVLRTDREKFLQLIEEVFGHFPTSENLWILKSKYSSANWETALAACPKSAKLYILAAEFSYQSGNVMGARAILERARRVLPSNEDIWVASIKIEVQSDSMIQAKLLLNRALQSCPTSVVIWNEAIFMEPRPTRKSKITEALRRCGNQPILFVALGQMMELEHNLTSAKEYYEKSIALDEQCGDAWAAYIRFTRKYYPDDVASVSEQCFQIEPKNGLYWKPFRKQDQFWRQPFKVTFEAFLRLE